jgi:EVE domain
MGTCDPRVHSSQPILGPALIVVIHTRPFIHSGRRAEASGAALSYPPPNVHIMTNWINTVSRDHVRRGVRGRFAQANHGKPDTLRKMAHGDWIVFYSPKTALEGGEPLRAFTAIGQIADDEPYEVEVTPDLRRWRRNVDFLSCTETPIRPLIADLQFIENKRAWGYRFRFGVFRIDDRDFDVIRSAMTG